MGVPVLRRGESAGAAAGGAQAGADAGGLWGAARWQARTAGLAAQPGRKSERMGRPAGRPVPARLERRNLAADVDGGLRGIGRSHADGVSASAASTLLGAQDARHSGARTQTRIRRSETGSAGDLS